MAWSNEKVGWTDKVVNFKDKKLKNSLFFIELMAKMEPRAVDWDIVNKGKFEKF